MTRAAMGSVAGKVCQRAAAVTEGPVRNQAGAAAEAGPQEAPVGDPRAATGKPALLVPA